mgnify:CR=1 FL=1
MKLLMVLALAALAASASRLPEKTPAPASIESAKKKSQARMSRA